MSHQLNIYPTTFSKEIDFSMIEVKGGKFQIQEGITVELPSFQLGQYPVTQTLWEAVMGENPAYFKGKLHPVERVNWYEAVTFCNQLSEKMELEPVYTIDKTRPDPNNENSYDDLKWLVTQNAQANGYRLPTEAEWEYAARGGAYSHSYKYAGSEHLEEVGWYRENSQSQTHPVGLLLPNELGLYDMSGNVWEWCWDWYGDYLGNPTGPESGQDRVLRGGSGLDFAPFCRVALRFFNLPDNRVNSIGLRLARTAL